MNDSYINNNTFGGKEVEIYNIFGEINIDVESSFFSMSSFVASQSRWTWYTKLSWCFFSVAALWRSNSVEGFVAIVGKTNPFEPFKSRIDQWRCFYHISPKFNGWNLKMTVVLPRDLLFQGAIFVRFHVKLQGWLDGRWGTLPPPVAAVHPIFHRGVIHPFRWWSPYFWTINRLVIVYKYIQFSHLPRYDF